MIQITFLGTGSAVPTARRNHPAVHLKYKSENMLFDCGEGTQRQFRKAHLNPCKLTRLFITHWHGDHILGIPGLLQTLMLNGYSKTLEVYGPRGTKKFMGLMLKLFAHKDKLKIKVHEVSSGRVLKTNDFEVVAMSLMHGTPTLAYSFIEKDKLRIDKKKLAKLKIGKSHLLQKITQGKDVVIKGKKIKSKDLTYLQKGKKVSIILDNRYIAELVKFAKDADLLICEATYFKETELAKEYKHLTVEQSAKIAKGALAKKLVLMHLSQRYEKDYREFLKTAKRIFKNSDVAKDLDRVEV